MRDLTEIRQQIDQIDQKMLALFKERMGCSAEVAEYKRGTGKAIYDPVRERQKIDALTKDEDELIIKKSVEEMFLQMMSISRRYQYSLLSQEDAYIDQTFEEVEAGNSRGISGTGNGTVFWRGCQEFFCTRI